MPNSTAPANVLFFLLIAAVLLFAPIIGVMILDLPVGPYLEFPPRTRHVIHEPFSWQVFTLILMFVAVVCFSFLHRLLDSAAIQEKSPNYRFPLWGWLGITVVVVFWTLAWNRFSFFESLQRYTFFPLWFGYILVVNALIRQRKGSCPLNCQPFFFSLLFPASALFWWYFEYLNRFVQNWYYLAGANISATEYILHAGICFSTVLPAVYSTFILLRTYPGLVDPFVGWVPLVIPWKKGVGWLFIVGAIASLALLAVFPDYLFPLVWVSPLLVIVGSQFVSGRPSIFIGVEKGDWQVVVPAALAALICGFFWELWNWKSLAHWEYSVPFVNRFHIFEMPLLGYAGYIPFGLECVAVIDLLKKALAKE